MTNNPTDRSCNCQYESGHAPTCPLYEDALLKLADRSRSWIERFDELLNKDAWPLVDYKNILAFIQEEKATSFMQGEIKGYRIGRNDGVKEVIERVRKLFSKSIGTTYFSEIDEIEKELLK